MLYNNNISVLPFYESINEQNHRKNYSYGDIYPLYTHTTGLLPFQIIRTHRSGSQFTVNLKNKEGIFVNDISDELVEAGLQVVSFEVYGYDVIVFPARLNNLSMAEGQYYIELSDDTETWYSDIISVVSDITKYVCLEWYCHDNVIFEGGQIVYTNPSFHNKLYLCAELGKPEYKYEEEGEDRDGIFFPEKQISEKIYKCVILAPEFLCDVMRLIRLADFIFVRDQYGHTFRCDQFLMTPEWQQQGNLASVELEMQTFTVVKKIGYGEQIELNGDFNNDYNDDYKIS